MPPDDTNDSAAIARELRDKLPVLSPHAASILRACENPNIDATTLAAMIGESPSIAARLLGLANSSFYSRGRPIYALPKAIQTLGLVTVRGIAIGLVLSSQFSPTHCPAFAAGRFWESAVLSAQLAQQLAFRVPSGLKLEYEAAYMTGLLHNIGLLALASLLPDSMNAALAAHGDESPPLSGQLRERLGFDHHLASSWLAEAWRLPDPMRLALEHHGDRSYRSDHWPLVLLTGLAARCAHAIILAKAKPEQMAHDEAETACALGIDAASVASAAARTLAVLDILQSTAETLSGQGKHVEKPRTQRG